MRCRLFLRAMSATAELARRYFETRCGQVGKLRRKGSGITMCLYEVPEAGCMGKTIRAKWHLRGWVTTVAR